MLIVMKAVVGGAPSSCCCCCERVLYLAGCLEAYGAGEGRAASSRRLLAAA